MPGSLVGRRPCILVIGPVPPPFGGVETVTESVLRSRLASRYRLIHLDTTQHRGSAARGFTTRNALVALARYCLLLWLVARHQPTVVYLPINSTRAGFLRDSALCCSPGCCAAASSAMCMAVPLTSCATPRRPTGVP